ncbi:ABC transporter ATP-binding protein [Actinospica sp. MGRD01-02]|uniref:ABC transporter ATP-binding protein n=1 Tax=Actinospica acidithermotolerans TaxID=2828514 RepID=A0A941IKZ9_9ACTN|nr:ABC transporter ATP-binding protein [Actinospica acidithermotolerans]MBR7827171.1 ABC transporter ATP-binding protein [Actinospica acidithermotolerans]
MTPTSRPSEDTAALLDVRDLRIVYDSPRGPVEACSGVNLTVRPGEFVGIVGESGCGKSTLLFGIAQLHTAPARIAGGEVLFLGKDLVTLPPKELGDLRWRNLAVVMQSAMNALNPVRTIGDQFEDAILAHEKWTDERIRERSAEVLRLVAIDPVHLGSYPHQLSGGMRQRAMIAMALLFTPDLIVMDEPTSALDVVAQRSLMVQIKELQQKLGFAVVFVTHDMSLVSHFSDRLLVMYAGQVVEFGPTRTVFDTPSHPYSRSLLDAFPSIRGPKVPLLGIPGDPPNLADPPAGCRFNPRCPVVQDACRSEAPELYPLEASPGVQSRCLAHRPTDPIDISSPATEVTAS